MVADGNTRGIRHLVPDFWDHAEDHGLPLPTVDPVSASAICQARARLDSDLFRDLLYVLGEEADLELGGTSTERWKGRRLLAVDGAKVNTRRSDDLERAFEVPSGGHCPQLLLSVLSDVYSRTPLDFEISGYRSCEREHLLTMLDSTEKGDLVLLDRGYPSHEVFQQLAKRELDYVVRLPSSMTFAAVDILRDSGEYDAEVEMELPADCDPDWVPMSVRIVRVDGPNDHDDPTFYATSLSSAVASIEELKDLYHLRWESEELFKTFKSEYIGQNQFRSTTVDGVKQEASALILFLAMSRLLARAAEAEGDESREPHDDDSGERVNRKTATFVSQKGAILALEKYLLRILLHPDCLLGLRAAQRASRRARQTLDRYRHDRSHPRRSFKPQPKWTATGRRGA